MRVLVVGATGSIGRRTAAEFARSSEVHGLVVAATDGDRAERVAMILGGSSGKVRAAEVDVRRAGTLAQAAAEADVVVSCAGPAYLLEASSVEGAIEASVPYISLCDDHPATAEVDAFDRAARDRGITIVSGCGLSPGITNLLVALAAAELDDVDAIDIAIATSSAEADGKASALHMLFQMTTEVPLLSDRRQTTDRPGGAAHLVYFPEPVGWVETFRCGHPEVLTLPRSFPNLQSLQFHVGLTEKVAMDVVRASAFVGLGKTEQTRSLWSRVTAPARPMIAALPPRGPCWTAARVDVWGIRAGRRTAISLACVDRLLNLASAPLVLAALELGAGRFVAPGVHAPDEILDPKVFLR
ncbi:MAG: saccharopine dehydrogenase family protein, partial [Actinomycetota bacterium]